MSAYGGSNRVIRKPRGDQEKARRESLLLCDEPNLFSDPGWRYWPMLCHALAASADICLTRQRSSSARDGMPLKLHISFRGLQVEGGRNICGSAPPAIGVLSCYGQQGSFMACLGSVEAFSQAHLMEEKIYPFKSNLRGDLVL